MKVEKYLIVEKRIENLFMKEEKNEENIISETRFFKCKKGQSYD
jgi:hypothetical protein